MKTKKLKKVMIIAIAVITCVAFTFSMPTVSNARSYQPTAQTKAPGKVTGLKVKQNKNYSLTISWNKVKKADKYSIYVYENKYKRWRYLWDIKKNKVTKSAKSLKNENIMFYDSKISIKVRAVINCLPKKTPHFRDRLEEGMFFAKYRDKLGKFSKKVTIRCKRIPNVNLKATLDKTWDSYTVSWNQFVGVKKYLLYRKVGDGQWTFLKDDLKIKTITKKEGGEIGKVHEYTTRYWDEKTGHKSPIYDHINKIKFFTGDVSYKLVIKYLNDKTRNEIVTVHHVNTHRPEDADDGDME